MEDPGSVPARGDWTVFPLCLFVCSRGACKRVNSLNWSRQDIALGSTVVQLPHLGSIPAWGNCILISISKFLLHYFSLGVGRHLVFIVPSLFARVSFVFGKWASMFHPLKSETRCVMLTCLETTCCQCRISLYISKSVPSSSFPTRVSPSPHYCALQYNKPCLKYINLAHNSSNVHPEGENRHYWLPVPGMFLSWLITEPAFFFFVFVKTDLNKYPIIFNCEWALTASRASQYPPASTAVPPEPLRKTHIYCN